MDAASSLFEDYVASQVSVSVVDPLEMIEVHHQDASLSMRANASLKLAREQVKCGSVTP